jgi:hypothetical protein
MAGRAAHLRRDPVGGRVGAGAQAIRCAGRAGGFLPLWQAGVISAP